MEHDEETIRTADWIVDIGPLAGEHGGEIIANGPLEVLLSEPRSITGAYLRGERSVPIPGKRRRGTKLGDKRKRIFLGKGLSAGDLDQIAAEFFKSGKNFFERNLLAAGKGVFAVAPDASHRAAR